MSSEVEDAAVDDETSFFLAKGQLRHLKAMIFTPDGSTLVT